MKRHNALLFLISTAVSFAQFTDIWRIGEIGDGVTGMSIESHSSESLTATSHQLVDDHYFLAGTYNTVGTVSNEPLNQFERALTGSDPNNFIYFSLDTAALNSGKEFQLQIQTDWGNFTQPDPNNPIDWHHELQVILNGSVVAIPKTFQTRELFQINIPPSLLSSGANTLQLERIGDTNNAYFTFDSIAFRESTEQISDSDNDGATDVPNKTGINLALSDNGTSVAD